MRFKEYLNEDVLTEVLEAAIQLFENFDEIEYVPTGKTYQIDRDSVRSTGPAAARINSRKDTPIIGDIVLYRPAGKDDVISMMIHNIQGGKTLKLSNPKKKIHRSANINDVYKQDRKLNYTYQQVYDALIAREIMDINDIPKAVDLTDTVKVFAYDEAAFGVAA